MAVEPKVKDWWVEKSDDHYKVRIIGIKGSKVQYEYEGNFRRGIVSLANFLSYFTFLERGR